MHHLTVCVCPAALLGYWSEVWTLCEALWGRLGPADQDGETPSEYKEQLERRRTFSAWLSHGATSRVEEEVALAGKGRHVEAVFSYLSGNRISDACRLAQKEGETGRCPVRSNKRSSWSRRLAANSPCVRRRPPSVAAAVAGGGLPGVSRPAGPSAGRLEPHADRLLPVRGADARLHAARWKTRKLQRLKLIGRFDPWRRFTCFLSSLQVWQSSDSVVNVCSELDWKRCVAVHLWYTLPPTASVADALAKYEAAFQVSATPAEAPPSHTCRRQLTVLLLSRRARVRAGSMPAPPCLRTWWSNHLTWRRRRRSPGGRSTTSASTSSNSTATGKPSPER